MSVSRPPFKGKCRPSSLQPIRFTCREREPMRHFTTMRCEGHRSSRTNRSNSATPPLLPVGVCGLFALKQAFDSVIDRRRVKREECLSDFYVPRNAPPTPFTPPRTSRKPAASQPTPRDTFRGQQENIRVASVPHHGVGYGRRKQLYFPGGLA